MLLLLKKCGKDRLFKKGGVLEKLCNITVVKPV